MIRVMVVDDHAVVRSGLSAIIGAQDDMTVVAEGSDGAQAVELCRLHAPDVVLMDLQMPGVGGAEATRLICQEHARTRVIVVTTFDGDEDIYRALQAGARAYLLKGMNRFELVEAIRRVHHGERVIPPEVAGKLAARVAGNELTARELDVLRLVVAGQSNREIARTLSLTEGTVKSYLKSVFGKLEVEDRTQAATTALRRGIVRLE